MTAFSIVYFYQKFQVEKHHGEDTLMRSLNAFPMELQAVKNKTNQTKIPKTLQSLLGILFQVQMLISDIRV